MVTPGAKCVPLSNHHAKFQGFLSMGTTSKKKKNILNQMCQAHFKSSSPNYNAIASQYKVK